MCTCLVVLGFAGKGFTATRELPTKEMMLKLFLIVPTFWSNKYPDSRSFAGSP